jgi:creatinine amidohydrolase/Fe(II)-dependent formamide hydrolase-like protein
VTYWELVDPALLRDLFPVDLGSIGHAGQAETSAMLAAAPGLVRPGPTAFEPITRANDPFLVPDMGVSGVLGDPAAASADAGERFLSAAGHALAELIDSLDHGDARS